MTTTTTISYGKNGRAYVVSDDINVVRDMLLIAGYRCGKDGGWLRDHDGDVTAIWFRDGGWVGGLGPTHMAWEG